VREKLRSVLAGNEADELRDAFLQSFLGVLGDFHVGRKHFLHDAADVGDGEEAVLLTEVGARTMLTALVVASATAAWTRRSIEHDCRNSNRRRGTGRRKNKMKLGK